MTDRQPPSPPVPPTPPPEASFAETALKLGGKSEEEARRTGAIDRADDQVEQLFKPQYQTVNSPIHRAVWDRDAAGRAVRGGAREHAAGRAAGDEPLARRRPPASRGQARCTTPTARSPTRCSTTWPRPATGACSSIASTAATARRCAASCRSSRRWPLVDPTIAGLASVHGCIGAVDPVRTFGNAEQKQRFLPKLASGERLSAFALTEPGAGSDLTALQDAGRARRRPLPRHRREAVHHQRRARPHDRPGLPDRRQAGGADRRSAAAGERAVPAREVRPVRPQAHVQPRHHLQGLPRAGGEPAASAAAATA